MRFRKEEDRKHTLTLAQAVPVQGAAIEKTFYYMKEIEGPSAIRAAIDELEKIFTALKVEESMIVPPEKVVPIRDNGKGKPGEGK